jgi:hypothetical protein
MWTALLATIPVQPTKDRSYLSNYPPIYPATNLPWSTDLMNQSSTLSTLSIARNTGEECYPALGCSWTCRCQVHWCETGMEICIWQTVNCFGLALIGCGSTRQHPLIYQKKSVFRPWQWNTTCMVKHNLRLRSSISSFQRDTQMLQRLFPYLHEPTRPLSEGETPQW